MQGKTYADFVSAARTRVREISCEDLQSRLRERPLILDIREADELATGVIPGSVHLPRGLIEKHAGDVAPGRDDAVLVYCSTGKRSLLAADTLRQMGYRDPVSVAGGFERWRELALPVESVGIGVTRAEPLAPSSAITEPRDWESVRREFAIVDRQVHVLGSASRRLVYLDHAASTHAPNCVLDTYREFMKHEYANVHRGVHVLSRKATERFDEVYTVIADFIGGALGTPGETSGGTVVLTGNTTQAIALAAHAVRALPGAVVTTEMEHHSNELPWRETSPVLRARIRPDGHLDLDHLESLLREQRVKLVAVTAGSNVTGIFPDLSAVARLAHEHGALVLADAAQALARIPLSVNAADEATRIDFLAAAGHKAYAPFGSAFLYGPRDLLDAAPPWIPGGGTAASVTESEARWLGSPDRHQGGTPNIGGAVAFSEALLFLDSIGRDAIRAHEESLLRRLLDGLQEIGGLTIYGDPDPTRRLGVVTFNVDGVSDMLAAAILSEEEGVAVRNGRFCSHIHVDRLLRFAHGAAAEGLGGAVRASVGLYNDESDVDRALDAVRKVRERRWVGKYRVRGAEVGAEFAGRCADRWMEARRDPGEAATGSGGYHELAVLSSAGACRAYLIADPARREAMLIDPLRTEVPRYLEVLEHRGYRLTHVIDTHTHDDHLSGCRRLREVTGATLLRHRDSALRCVDRELADGDVILVGEVELRVLATPGHGDDHIALFTDRALFAGDALLSEACRAVELRPAAVKRRLEGLRRLASLPDDTRVFPAHDPDGETVGALLGDLRAAHPLLTAHDETDLRARLLSAHDDERLPMASASLRAENRRCEG